MAPLENRLLTDTTFIFAMQKVDENISTTYAPSVPQPQKSVVYPSALLEAGEPLCRTVRYTVLLVDKSGFKRKAMTHIGKKVSTITACVYTLLGSCGCVFVLIQYQYPSSVSTRVKGALT